MFLSKILYWWGSRIQIGSFFVFEFAFALRLGVGKVMFGEVGWILWFINLAWFHGCWNQRLRVRVTLTLRPCITQSTREITSLHQILDSSVAIRNGNYIKFLTHLSQSTREITSNSWLIKLSNPMSRTSLGTSLGHNDTKVQSISYLRFVLWFVHLM